MFTALKAQALAARKAQDQSTLTLLSTLIGDLQAGAKLVDGEKVVTDDEVLAMVRKFLKGVNETLTHDAINQKAMFEKNVLEALLPQQMTEAELAAAVATMVADGASNMGVVMGQLKSRHAGLYDGKMASQLAKAAFA